MKLLLFAPLAQAAEACACAEGLASIKLELAVLRKQHVAELSELRALLVEMAASSSATAILEPMGLDISPVASTATPSGRTLEQWVERAAASPLDSCATAFPSLRDGDSFHYGGCNRNVHRNTTISVETCQTGNVTLYNTSTVASNGLFDIAIAANTPTHDVWHFVCGLAHDDPHRATYRLTARLQFCCNGTSSSPRPGSPLLTGAPSHSRLRHVQRAQHGCASISRRSLQQQQVLRAARKRPRSSAPTFLTLSPTTQAYTYSTPMQPAEGQAEK